MEEKKDSKLIQPYYYVQFDDPTTGYRGLRNDNYNFVIHATKSVTDSVILFDRNTDPYQMKNIADKNEKLVKQLSKQLKQFLKGTNDQFAEYIR